MSQIPDVVAGISAGRKLLHVVEDWLRVERDERCKREERLRAEGKDPSAGQDAVKPSRTPFSMPSKHLAFFR